MKVIEVTMTCVFVVMMSIAIYWVGYQVGAKSNEDEDVDQEDDDNDSDWSF